MIKRPPQPYKLLRDENWLRAFTTSEQRKSILKWFVESPTKRPTGIEIRETRERANRIILHLERETAEF
jgi:hypothetical protein